MKTHKPIHPWLLAPLVLAPLSLCAADNDPALRLKLEEPKNERLNRFSVSYSAGFNMDAKFGRIGRGVGSGGPPGPGPATGGGIDRQYDDGYVKRSSFGSDAGLTWNWGYKNASQLDAANDRLQMHSTRATGGESRADGDPQHGFQLTFNRELGRCKDTDIVWGLEMAFGWTDIRINDGGPVRSGTKTITDTYTLNGVRPPWFGGGQSSEYPEHAGDFEGPGTLIEDAPNNRSEVSSRTGARAVGSREFDADLFFFHFGPYVEFPIVEKLRGVVSGGLAWGVMAGHYEFVERVTLPSGGTGTARGDVDNVEALVGGFVNATLLYPINDCWSVFAGGQYQTLNDYTAKGAGRKVTIDLTTAAFFTAGVAFSF